MDGEKVKGINDYLLIVFLCFLAARQLCDGSSANLMINTQ